jgi:hypothetical protein
MQGFVGADLLGFLDGMQGVRGSNPLSSTRHNASSTPALSAICQGLLSDLQHYLEALLNRH